jgi:hypothetical protein
MFVDCRYFITRNLSIAGVRWQLMGTSKKPSRKKDLKKAQSLHRQYLDHQAKLINEPEAFAAEHWRKEKKNFLSQTIYYVTRAGMKIDDLHD